MHCTQDGHRLSDLRGRRTRAVLDSMQRIRYGLTGLAIVFLIVLLGTAIIRGSGQAEDDNAVNLSEPNDPLGELGVAPGQASEEKETNAAGTR